LTHRIFNPAYTFYLYTGDGISWHHRCVTHLYIPFSWRHLSEGFHHIQ